MSHASQPRSGALHATILLAAAAAGEPANAAEAQLEEITVTARKEAESLQDAPIAVSAFTAETIADRGITDINALASFTPGLSFSQAFGRSTDRPVVRGQSNVLAGVQFGVESGTAYFLDGVYYNGDVQAIDFDSLERVEVIKGPQSALYGRNTYAGAINFITRDPGDAWTGSIRASGAQHDERTYSANFSGPLVGDSLSVRFGARYNEYGGEYRNALTGKSVGQERDWTVSGSLLWKPVEGFRARLFLSHREQRDGPLALFLVGGENNNCMPGFRSPGYRGIGANGAPTNSFAFGQLAPIANPNQYYCGVIRARPDLVRLNTDPVTRTNPASGAPVAFTDGTAFDGIDVNEDFASLALEYDVAGTGWTVTSLTGYRHKFDLFGTDSDHSDAQVPGGGPGTEPLFANTNRNDAHEWSTELKLASPSDRRLRGTVGAYWYQNDDVERDLTYASPSSAC